MTYSTKIQEALYRRPLRIQIVQAREFRGYGARAISWHLVQRDMLTGTVAQVYASTTSGRFSDERVGEWRAPIAEAPPNQWRSATAYTKGVAFDLAKAQAMALGLPFDPQRDSVPAAELDQGPEQPCVGCGSPAGRAWEAKLCAACQAALAAGREAIAERERGGIEPDELLPVEFAWSRIGGQRTDLSQELARALLEIAGGHLGEERWNPHGYGEDDLPFLITASKRRPERVVQVRLTASAARAVEKVIKLIGTIAQLAHQIGHAEGESLLLGLSDGRVSVDQFNERAMGGPRKTQKSGKE